MKIISFTKAISLVAMVALISGCAAISDTIHHRKLQTNTCMSETIFLDPTLPQDKVIYIQYHNTTNQPDLQIKQALISDLEAHHWTVTDNFAKAKRMMQVNVIQAGKAASPQDVTNALNGGYGGALAGGLTGVAISGTWQGAAAGAAIGGVADWLSGELIRNETYSVITDVQISVKLPKGEHISQNAKTHLQQGTSTTVKQHYQTNTDWVRYRVRLVSYANKVNLKFAAAAPVLSKEIATALANLFID